MNTNHHLADVLQRFLPSYRQQYPLSYRQALTCQHILDCRTAKLGSQQWQCEACNYEQVQYCSCRDRHCPRCQGQKSQKWIAQQQSQVIHGRYFHLVFTLPHELNVISQYAPKALYSALFQAVWQTLSRFAANRNKHRGQLGLTTVLHTWGQTLSQHIHLHCLVPGGVLTAENKWVGVKGQYLYPVKALSTVFRAKMLQVLRTQQVEIPHTEALMAKSWCVYSKPCLNRPDTVIKYLARYTQKGMMHESRLTGMDNSHIKFSYKDYHQPGQTKEMRLTGVEFIRRYLQHILPKGFMRIRHYGYLANRCRRRKLALIKTQTERALQPEKTMDDKPLHGCWQCPECRTGLLKLVSLRLPTRCNVDALRSPLTG